MIDAGALSAVSFALIAGITTFFSPCAYPLLPGYVGYYVSQTDGEEPSLGGALSRGFIAGAGVLVTLGILFLVAFQVSHATLSNLVYFEPIAGAVLVIFGVLIITDRAPSLSVPLPKRRSSLLGFGIFGSGYALAAAGCVAPLFVGVVMRAVSAPTTTGAMVVGTYVGSVVALMVALTVVTGMGLVAAGQFARFGPQLKQFAGVVMILAGLGQLYLSAVLLGVL
ncbi:cytochrome C biogenesis protein [Natronolimnobius sp. AArcel1]|uniref:cytochrome c biogenesis CcdA family protein n=1 Tax=Natronolimnobius sp. AArcel1 TaxID=1679093 RepID=UPI0013EC7E4A|nr:cytochrome c biogenesis protein CcdA [Natronolimnobius sp. AArcel1]NGM71527.1 cytochrome C biogenesis protein [Natronolimnobius sp. AArcel1]